METKTKANIATVGIVVFFVCTFIEPELFGTHCLAYVFMGAFALVLVAGVTLIIREIILLAMSKYDEDPS